MKNTTAIQYFIPGFLLFFCFVMPLQIYIIGDSSGIGMQGAFFRYQVTGYGNSFISLHQDVDYIITGIYDGKTAASVISWLIAALFLAAATITSLMTIIKKNGRKTQIIFIFLFISTMSFIMSLMIQYGILLEGPAGKSLPVGVVLLFVFSSFCFRLREIFF